jgi:hypothetical protein
VANGLAAPFPVYYYKKARLQCDDFKRGGICLLSPRSGFVQQS